MEGGDQETAADLARLLDSYSEQPDPAAARAGMAPYLGDIDRYMLELEASRRLRDDYMWTTQKDIRPNMRAVLVDWLVEVAQEFRLPSDTLHLAVSYVDRFLSAIVISRDKLQLLGVTALLVAAKYEDDIFLHEVEKYTEVTDNTYTRQQVVKMETDILKFLNYEMGSPTARTFLQRYITACHGGDRAKAKKLEPLCSYLADLSLLDYDCIRFNPSVVAATCLFVARFTISPTTRPWNLTLQRNTDYKVSDLKSCLLMIHGLQLNGTYPGLKEEAIKVKYNDGELERVSAMDPPQQIPAYFLKDIEPLKGQSALATSFAAVAEITNSFVSRLVLLQFLLASSYPRLLGCCRISFHVAVPVALIAAWLAALIC